MALRKWISLFCVVPFHAFGQFVETFEDGNFTHQPPWSGRTSHFSVIDGKLQTSGPPGADTAWLSTPYAPNTSDTLIWQWSWSLDFAPSNNNYGRVYLSASESQLIDGDGVFVRLGENGSNDVLKLYRQENGMTVLLASGTTILSSDPNVIVRVKRFPDATWVLESTATPSLPFNMEATVIDSTVLPAGFFGIWCKYTSSNSNAFSFDDIFVDSTLSDTIAPRVRNLEVVSGVELMIVTDEVLDASSVYTTANFVVLPEQTVASIAYDTTDSHTIHLRFSEPFPVAEEQQLWISNVTDDAGNELDTTLYFQFFDPRAPQYGELVINEIMSDPSPPLGLPEAEYVELFNTTDRYITLSGISFSDPSTSSTLPGGLIPPKGFVIICAAKDSALFPSTWPLLALDPFPALNNGGDDLVLASSGTLLDRVTYSSDWYGPDPPNGGVALERINPGALCSGEHNWGVSTALEGGTPGFQNSIFNNDPDGKAPYITRVLVSDSNTITLHFSESIDTTRIDDGEFTMPPFQVDAEFSGISAIILQPSGLLKPGKPYDLSVSGVFDCAGNALMDTTLVIGQAVPASPFDIVITELLPSPSETGPLPNAEYVEIYNRSGRIIDLSSIELADRSSAADLPELQMLPGTYGLIVEDNLIGDFEGSFLRVPVTSMPSLNNGTDLIRLLDLETVIDEVEYAQNYFTEEAQTDGWALERVDIEALCIGDSNWRTSRSSLQGTPGKANSVAAELSIGGPKLIDHQLSSSREVVLRIDQRIDTLIRPQLALLETPSTWTFGTDRRSILLHLDADVRRGAPYTLHLKDLIACDSSTTRSAYYTLFFPEPGDLILNEVLFDPLGDGHDFIELLNTSNDSVNLSGMLFNNGFGSDEGQSEVLARKPLVIPPNSYLAFTEDPDQLVADFPLSSRHSMVGTQLPSLPNDEGGVRLVDPTGFVLDSMRYDVGMHFPLLTDPEGVSLERISPSAPSARRDSWHSASSSVGYATPGYANSQHQEEAQGMSAIYLSATTISPDNDGFEDVIALHYQGLPIGSSLTVEIFHPSGALVRTLASNELVGAQGAVVWDGTNDEGAKAGVGIYLILAEIFQLNGRVQRFRLPFVVTAKAQ